MTKPSNDEVATILETAADLYESEQVDWCVGSWVAGNGKKSLSACAEGALLLGSGYSALEVFERADSLFNENPGARAAHNALLGAINDSPLGFRYATIYLWNDSALGRNFNPEEGNDGSAKKRAKAEVIEKMKQAAKNVRNS